LQDNTQQETKPKRQYNYTKKPGRPSTYKPEYPQQLIKFFNSFELTKQIIKKYTTKNGTIIEEPIERSNKIPTFQAFARSIETTSETLEEWAKKNVEFAEAYSRAKDIQKEFIFQNTLSGLYDSKFAQFFAKNCLGMKDQVAVEASGGLTLRIISFGEEKKPDKGEVSTGEKAQLE